MSPDPVWLDRDQSDPWANKGTSNLGISKTTNINICTVEKLKVLVFVFF